MAKEKAGGQVLLRGNVVQSAANAYAQLSLLTGINTSGNDALVVKQIGFEIPSYLNLAAGIVEIEAAISRASKAAMPTIFDDDVLYKYKSAINWGAPIQENPVIYFVPVQELVVIEDIIYCPFKTLNVAAALNLTVTILAQPATVTDAEKVGLLLSRIN